jgi:hypothetical protein
MSCECSQLPQIFNIENYYSRLMTHLEIIDQKDGGWLKLFKCSVCNQHWQVDLIDRLQVNCAIKIDDSVEWQNFDDKSIRIQYLISSRGGLSEEECVTAGCKNKALKSLAHCPKHAYENVGLRE